MVVIMVFGLLPFGFYILTLLFTTRGEFVIDNMSWCAVVFVCGGDNHDEYC